jgi:UDP-N-acetyl-D-mannosaminuronate dehydrogenase
MHDFVADAVVGQLEALGKTPALCDVIVCGLAFKGRPETGDYRNSPAIAIARNLKGRVREVFGHDPVVPADAIAGEGLVPAAMPEGVKDKDAVLILNNHPSYEKMNIFSVVRSLRPPGIFYDGWHMFSSKDILAVGPCVYMGLGFSVSSVVR